MSSSAELEEEIARLSRQLRMAHWNSFTGPCPHGADPYTRCQECGHLSPLQARDRAVAERVREACAREALDAANWCETAGGLSTASRVASEIWEDICDLNLSKLLEGEQ